MSEIRRSIILNCLKGKYSFAQIINLFGYALGRKRPVVPWQPLYLTIFTTYKCNLNCDMCLTHSHKHANLYGQKPTKDMDFNTFKEILDRYHKAVVVNLTGNGEPLLNADFFKMADYASRTRCVFCSTNGTLIDKHKEEIANSGLALLIISINGHSEEEYARLTGMRPEDFQLVVQNTKGLVKFKRTKGLRKPKIWVSFIADRENYIHLEKMVDFSIGLGVDGVLFLPFIPSPAEGFTAQERCLFSDEQDIIYRINASKRLRHKIEVILPVLLNRQVLEGGTKKVFCNVPFYNMTVDGAGNIGGCSCQLLDNSQNGKFYEKNAWNNAYFQSLRNNFLNPQATLPRPCSWCYRII